MAVLLSRGRSCSRGGETARGPVRGRDVVLPPDMARRRVRASSSGSLGGRSARELVGRSGVLGQGMAMVFCSKGAEGSGGVTRRVATVPVARALDVGAAV